MARDCGAVLEECRAIIEELKAAIEGVHDLATRVEVKLSASRMLTRKMDEMILHSRELLAGVERLRASQGRVNLHVSRIADVATALQVDELLTPTKQAVNA